MNAFYFPTGDSQKDSGLEIEIMLDTVAACSIRNYQTLPEIGQFRQPITVVRSKKKTKTYTSDIVPMIEHTTLSFSFDSDGEHQFELRSWITETQSSNPLGIEFCRQYVSKLHIEIPEIKLKNTANAICYGNMCSTKCYPFVSKIHTIRTPHQIHINAKTSRLWKYSSEEKSKSFPPGTTFNTHPQSVKSGLDFVNILFTQSKNYLPILMENNRNQQITLNKGVIGYSSLGISDYDRPKYQTKDCIQMVNSILTENDQYNKCFLLHSTVPCEPDMQDKIQRLNGNDETIFQANTAIAHCISADAKMSKGFAETICRRVNGLHEFCRRAKTSVGSALLYWDPGSNNFIYNLVTKSRFFEKPTLDNLRISLENMRRHALLNNITKFSMPKIGCGLDKLQWTDVSKLIQDTFTYSGILIQIITKRGTDSIRRNASPNNEHYIKDEVENYTNEGTNERDGVETDFTGDSKSCRPPCTEQFPILRPKQLNDDLIDYYPQYQSEDIKHLVKQFDFGHTDLEDEELVTLIDMIIDSRDVYSQHKFDISQTKQKFHVTLKTNSGLKKKWPNKCALHLEDKLEKPLGQLQDSGIIREMGDGDELGSLFVNPIKLLPKAD